jgi:hypothetical protein
VKYLLFITGFLFCIIIERASPEHKNEIFPFRSLYFFCLMKYVLFNEFLDILKHINVISPLFIISLFKVLSINLANKFANVTQLFLRILHFSLHFTCLFDLCFFHFPPGNKYYEINSQYTLH